MSSRALVVGIGRPGFGDDALGLEAAEALAGRLQGLAHVVADTRGGWSVLYAAEGTALLVLVDAAEGEDAFPAGRWCRLHYRGDAGALLFDRLRGTHTAGVASILEMGATLGKLPDEVWIYVMAGERFAPEAALSPSVAASLGVFVQAIERDVECWIRRPAPQPATGDALDGG